MFKDLFDTTSFMPHGHCYLWLRSLLALHIISDSLIALSYYSIPITLMYFAKNKTHLPYRWVFRMFGVFIVACGTTHLMEVITIYIPLYWLSGSLKAVTALLSAAAAITIIPLVPKALTLRDPLEFEAELTRRTERAEAQEEIRRLNEDLERKVTQRTLQLTVANKDLEAFSYSISHDLRAPLRGIDGFSRILLETQSHRLDAEGLGYLNRVCAAVKRMGSLIDDMLALSRLSRTEMRRESVDLSVMGGDIFRELQEMDPRRQLHATTTPNLIVQGDSHLLRAVLENLIGNAWKFTSHRQEAKIVLGVEEIEGIPTYFVRDNGAGFDMAHCDQLFGAFQRLHSTEEFPGNGIGLASAQRIIHRHGGRIWAKGEVDRGATFYFTIGSAHTEVTHD